MKIKPKMKLMFGESITAAYPAWGECQGEKLMRWTSNPRMVLIREQSHFFISSAKGRSI